MCMPSGENTAELRMSECPCNSASHSPVNVFVRATADGGAELAGDPKLNIFTE